MKFKYKEMYIEADDSKEILQNELFLSPVTKKEFSDFIVKEEIECKDMIIREEVNDVDVKTEDCHQVLKPDTVVDEIVLKIEASFNNIEIKKEDSIGCLETVDFDNFIIKEEINNFDIDSYMDLDISSCGDTPGDITIKEEQYFLDFMNSERISHNYPVDETDEAQEESNDDGSSVQKESDAQQKNWKINEEDLSARNRQREYPEIENNSSNKTQMKASVPKNYHTVLKSSSKDDTLNRRQYKDERVFKCNNCDYSTSRIVYIQAHVNNRTCEKPFEYSYYNYDDRTPTGKRCFKCADCDYSSDGKSCLIRHMRIHTGEKPFKCSDCDYRAARKIKLRQHIKTHKGEKLYKLSGYDHRRQRRVSALNIDLRSLIDEKPFKCTYCGYVTVQKSELNIHMKLHKGEKTFKCSDCDFRASGKVQIKQHIVTHNRNLFKMQL